MSDELDLRPDEVEHIATSGRCGGCGHLDVLHTTHCCWYCNVGECPCEDGYEPSPNPEDRP